MTVPTTLQEFQLLASTVKECTGVRLTEQKKGLLESRLKQVLKEYQLASAAELCAAIRRSDGESLKWRLAECVLVHESYFFRDRGVFDCFEGQILPALLQARATARRLRIWCAACATGQEPYSIAMVLANQGDLLKGWDVDILATDFSEETLLVARRGIYSQFEVQRGLPVRLLVQFFKPVAEGWEIAPEIRDMVRFRHQNLLHNGMRHGVFDVILCRNVLMYFDEETKRQVLSRLSSQVEPGGYIVLGATETVEGRDGFFAPLQKPCPGVFRLRPHNEREDDESAGEAVAPQSVGPALVASGR